MVRGRESKAVDGWVQANLLALEQLETVDGTPAAALAVETTRGVWRWIPIVPLIAVPWLRGVLLWIFPILIVLFSIGFSVAKTNGYYIAVTDRRVLLQRLKPGQRGRRVGPTMVHPRRNVSVLSYKESLGRYSVSTLVLSIQEPASPRKLSLAFGKLRWQKNAEAIKKALEQAQPGSATDPT